MAKKRVSKDTTQLMMCSRVGREIINNQKAFYGNLQVESYTETSGKIYIPVRITAEDSLTVEKHALTYFDIVVIDAISTIYRRNQYKLPFKVTASDIYRVITASTKKVSEKIKKTITESIDRLSHMTIDIDATEDDTLDVKRFKSILLPVDIQRISSQNKKIPILEYTISEISALYVYAHKKKYIAYVDEKHLGLDKMETTLDTVLIGRYLLQRIMQMRNPNMHYKSRTIALDRPGENGKKRTGLLPDLSYCRQDFGSDSAWENKKSKINKVIKLYLDHFVDLGLIKEYNTIKRKDKKDKKQKFKSYSIKPHIIQKSTDSFKYIDPIL